MNVNAPEKIYIACDVVTEEGRAFILEHPVSYLKSVEYTRTDAFIDKACKWIFNQANIYTKLIVGSHDGSGYASFYSNKMVDDFKNYMKGE